MPKVANTGTKHREGKRLSNLSAIETVRTRLSVDAPDGIRLGQPVTTGAMTVFPLFHEAAAIDYLLSGEAQLSGLVRVSEVSESGEVSWLLVANKADLPVLFVEGEVLVGLKQNRVINTTMLVPAKSELKVPVTCVEAGRWQRSTPVAGRDAYHLSAKIRGRKQASLAGSVRATGQYLSDQGDVWAAVGDSLSAHRVEAASMAYSEINRAKSGEVKAALGDLKPAPGQKGLLVFSGGEPSCLDLFDRSSTLEALWDGLLGSYMLDAMVATDAGKAVDSQAAREWITELGKAQATAHPAIGLGETVAVTGRAVTAGALVTDNVLVHLGAFATSSQPGPRTQFNRSWRRRPTL